MKTITYLSILLSIVCFVLVSCSQDDTSDITIRNGEYSGSFTVQYDNGDVYTNVVSVRFASNSSYDSSRASNRYPAGGDGTYNLQPNTIAFFDANVWTTDFDHNLILNGSYHFSQIENKIIISKTVDDLGYYEYLLQIKE